MDDIETFSAAALAAPHPAAAAAGRDVLVEGGNVIEAALAAAMTLAAVAPASGGLGGDALWLIREAGPRGRVRALDARGAVAAAARLSFFRDRGLEAVPAHGPEAVLVVPGAVAGWIEAHALSVAMGGRLPVSRLLAPAVAAARDGWDASARDADLLGTAAPALLEAPGFASAFLAEGRPPPPGTRRRAPALAGTLEYLSGAGLHDVHRGDVGRELAADLEALSCPLARADLRAAGARWREPRAIDLARSSAAVSPTRAGLCAAAALGLAGGLAAAGFDVGEADGVGRWHGLIEAAWAAGRLLDRAEAAGRDLDDVLDPARLARFALALDRGRAGRSAIPSAPLLGEASAWIGAIDRDGAAVSVVTTMGGAFGSGVVSARTGVLLNGRGAALAIAPHRGPDLRPGRRVPLAALPAILSNPREGRVAALGAAGQGAAAAVVQLADRLARGMGSGEALAAARFGLGATPDGRDAAVLVDAARPPPGLSRLRAAGHVVVEGEAPPWTAGLMLRGEGGRVSGAADDGVVEGI